MRRFLLVFAAVMMGFMAQAQIVSSSSSRVVRIVEEKPAKPKKPVKPFETMHYIKGGVNVNQMLVPETYIYLMEATDIPGLHLMYGMEKPFRKDSKTVCAYWGYEAGVSRWAFNLVNHDLNGYGSYGYSETWPEYKNVCQFGAQFAPKLGYKIGSRGKKFSMGVEVGAYVNYTFGTPSYLFDEYNYVYDDEYNIDEATSAMLMDALFSEWNDLEAGVFLGFGFWMRSVYLGFRYSTAVTPSFDYKEVTEIYDGYYLPAGEYIHENFYISLGISF